MSPTETAPAAPAAPHHRLAPGFWTAATALTALFLVLSGYAAWSIPWTVDEPTYVTAGELLRAGPSWDTGTSRLHGPLPFHANQLAARLGWSTRPLNDYRLAGRLGMLLFSLAGLWLTTALAARWFGRRAALATMFLYATCPVLLVHGSLMTTDNSLVPFYVGALAVTWRFLDRPGWLPLPLLGGILGAALATKYLGLFLVPVLALALGGVLLVGFRPALLWSRQRGGFLPRCGDAALAALLVGVTAWGTLWTCYGFRPDGFDAQRVETSSAFFARLLDLPLVPHVLGTLPEPWILGVDYMKFYSEAGGLAWFAGRVGDGSPLYYVTALVTKLPLALLLCILTGAALPRPRWPRHAAWICGVGIVLPLAYLSFFQALQIGLRHMLQVLPLLCLLGGRALGAAFTPGPAATLRRTLGLGAVLWTLGFLVVQRADWLGAFNAATTRPEWLFVDSNLDWTSPNLGDDPQREALEDRYPDAERVHGGSGPRLGTVFFRAIDFTHRTDAEGRPLHWLAPLRPVDRFGGWLVFEVTPDTLELAANAPRRSPPDHDRILLDAAVAHAVDGDPDRALRLLGSVPAHPTRPARHQAAQAVASLRRADPTATVPAALAASLERYDLVVASVDAPPGVRAQAAFQLFRWQEALEILDAARADGPGNLADSLLRIALLRLLERTDEALQALDELAASPTPPPAEILDQLRGELLRLDRENAQVDARLRRR